MLGSVVGCVQGFEALFLAMSAITKCWAVLWGVFMGYGVLFLAMSGTS